MIELERVTRLYRLGDQEVRALDDVSIAIRGGEYISIMGPSGSGKSTLLNIIGLLDHATSGRYLLDGLDVTSLSDAEQAERRRESIGFVFQSFHLIPRLTAFQNVELPLVIAGIPLSDRAARVREVLSRVGLEERSHHRPDQLSGGQRQRVAIARATIMRPSVILADEPTGNLDQNSGKEVMELLESLNSEGITLVVVTHDPNIGAHAKRTIHMVDGRIVKDSSLNP